MTPDWLARVVAARHAPAAGVAVLSFAAGAQAAAEAAGKYGTGGTEVALNFAPLCLLALAATAPLLFLRPAAAVIVITAANALLLAGFESATVAGVLAQLIAAYRNDTWGEMRTKWAFTIEGGKISRFETGQA